MAERDTFEIDEARTLEPNRLGRNVSLGLSGLWLLGGVAALAHFGTSGGGETGAFVRVWMMGILGGLASAWYFQNLARKASRIGHQLRAAAGAVFLGEERVAAREEIKAAIVLPSATGGAIVRIERHGRFQRALDYSVARIEDARAFIKALGHGGAQVARRFAIAAPSRSHFRKRLYAMWAFIPAYIAILVVAGRLFGKGPYLAGMMVFGFVALLALLGLWAKSGHVTVGADGVRIGWLWQKSFIPIADLERAEAIEGEVNAMGYYPILVRIHRRSGTTVEVMSRLGRSTPFTPRHGKWRDFALVNAAAIAERINEAICDEGSGRAAPALATWESELLSRGERAIGTWVAALRGLHSDVASFRKQAGGGLDALWGVLEDAAAEPERRAAAAVALSPHLDEEGRGRVRIAAQATAAPKLRIALEAAADADAEALASALEAVSVAPRLQVTQADG